MADREKVIKGLKCIKGDTIPCKDCGYSDADGYGNYTCKINCATDALELIDTQYKLIRELQNLISAGTKMLKGR